MAAMISHLSIGLATRADAAGISLLSGAEIEYGLPQTWTPQRVSQSIRNPETNVAVARDGPRLVGFGVMDYGDARAHLSLLAVREVERRQGVGSALLAWLEASALTAGIGIVRAEVRWQNLGARQFYRVAGYRDIERVVGYYQGREDALRLEKRIPA